MSSIPHTILRPTEIRSDLRVPVYSRWEYSNGNILATIPRDWLFLHIESGLPCDLSSYTLEEGGFTHTGDHALSYGGLNVFAHPVFGGWCVSQSQTFPGVYQYLIYMDIIAIYRGYSPQINPALGGSIIPILLPLIGILGLMSLAGVNATIPGRRRKTF